SSAISPLFPYTTLFRSHEVHDDLLDLARVRLDVTQVLVQLRDQLDVLADQASEHRDHRGHARVQIEHPRLQDLPAAVGEELAGRSEEHTPELQSRSDTV